MVYTEIKTRVIYEVKFFDDCALVRPFVITGGDRPEVERLDLSEFMNRFEEYAGDASMVEDVENDQPIVDGA